MKVELVRSYETYGPFSVGDPWEGAGMRAWVAGARPRTLPAAVAPVLVGTAIAYADLADELRLGSASWGQFVGRALLALVVALALQVGVNYANDYSDGIRGTDDVRVGPVRLVGQQLATPAAVKRAAFLCFAIAALAGLALVILTQAWWLIAVGAAAILAAWFYTGGPSPYGYAGLGELFVFVFFGLVAVAGTAYVQIVTITWRSLAAGVAVGALSVAILLVNNLRDIPTDRIAGKRTLAVRLGDHATRTAYSLAIATPYLVAIGIAIGGVAPALLALVSLPLAISPARIVRGGATGRDLIPALAGTGLLLLGYAVALSLGFVLAAD